MVLNTGVIDIETAAHTIADVCQRVVTLDQEERGVQKLQELLAAQRLVNVLIFEHNLNINFLKAYINGDTVTLQGVANSSSQTEQATAIAARMMPDKKIVSSISIVQDFKSYP
jgi:sugar diacid utilization regulator